MNPKLKDFIASLIIVFFYVMSFYAPEWTGFMIYLVLSLGIIFHGQMLGKYLFPKSSWLLATFFGLICYFGLQSIIQTSWFYLDQPLTKESDIITVAFSMLACNFLVLFLKSGNENSILAWPKWTFRKIVIAFLIASCGLASSAFVIINCFRSATLDSIRTPWPLLPAGIITATVFTWLAVILAVWAGKSRGLAVFQSTIAIFTTTAMAPLIYRLGFGFDGFLHIAAQKVLLTTGTLWPKPFYYLGQYVFSTWLSRSADLPLDLIDRWLVPLTAAFLIPLSLYISQSNEKKIPVLFFLFLAPLSVLVNTTPQSFAYILCLVSLFLTLGLATKQVRPMSAFILSAWAVAVHPLAGIPVFFVVLAAVLISLKTEKYKTLKIILVSLSAMISAASVPTLFYLLSSYGNAVMDWNLASILSLKPWQEFLSSIVPWMQNSFVVFPAWASLSLKALPFILLSAAVLGIFAKTKEERAPVILFVICAILLFMASTFLKSAGDFAFLIDYERGNYADRLIIIAELCLLPAALPGLTHLLERAREKQPTLGLLLLLGFLALAGAQSYNALPRHDALVTGRGWSVGQADIEAVNLIDRDASGADYTVLANQSVAAAAVSQFGFKRYAGDVFFYPIPTGGPLYNLFLNMTYKEPSTETIAQAGKLGKSKLVYVVLNDYWWEAAQTAEQISDISHAEWKIGESDAGAGQAVNVYKFDLNKPIKRKTDSSEL